MQQTLKLEILNGSDIKATLLILKGNQHHYKM